MATAARHICLPRQSNGIRGAKTVAAPGDGIGKHRAFSNMNTFSARHGVRPFATDDGLVADELDDDGAPRQAT